MGKLNDFTGHVGTTFAGSTAAWLAIERSPEGAPTS
jgi:hypothetical protein